MARNRNRRGNRRTGNQGNRRRPQPQPRPRQQPARRPRRQNRPRVQNRRRGGIGAELGGAVGGLIGVPKIGRMVGSTIGRIFGSGDYVLGNMPIQNNLAGTTPPMFGSTTGATRIRHREYVGDITSSTAFTCWSYALNPGNPALFPWLSFMTQNYEQYRFSGLVVEFKSTSSNALNSTNTALGTIGIVTQYDVTNPDFSTKQAAENYQGAQACNPSQSLLHFVECAPRTGVLDRYYCRGRTLNPGEDPKFYDMGKVCFFTQGSQAVATIGEMWVSYDVEFFTPKQPDALNNSADYYKFTNAGTTVSTTIYGSGYSPMSNGLGTFIAPSNMFTIPSTSPTGRYIVVVDGRTATLQSNWAFSAPIYTNCTGVGLWNNGTDSVFWASSGGSPYGGTYQFCCDHIYGQQSTIQMTTNVQMPTAGNCYVTINVNMFPITAISLAPSIDIEKPLDMVKKALAMLGFDVQLVEKSVEKSEPPSGRSSKKLQIQTRKDIVDSYEDL